MRRFFVEGISKDSVAAEVTGDEFTHLKKVLRLSLGDTVELFNGEGLALSGTIASIDRTSAGIKITGATEGKKESLLRVALLQGMLKGEKPELVVQKATELGVHEVVFYSTARTVPELSPDKTGARLKRWRKVAVEAAKQCGRAVVPALSLTTFASALEGRPGLKVMLWEGHGPGEAKSGLREALKRPEAKDGITVLIGPEGGFSDDEVVAAKKAGFITAGLGPRVLRAETAAIAAVTAVQYERGDMN